MDKGTGTGTRKEEGTLMRRGGRPKSETPLASALVPLDAQTPLYGQLRTHLEALEVRAFSPRTLQSRRRELMQFITWCTEREIKDAAEVKKPMLVHYQRWLFHYKQKNGAPLSTSSQYTRLSAIKQLFSWLTREDFLGANPAADLQLPKLGRALPKDVLTAQEAENILAQPDLEKPLGLRDRALLEVLYSTGIRRMELVALGIYDLDSARGCLHVRQGKGKKDRVIPIGERALLWVRKYLDDVRPLLAFDLQERALFLTSIGEPLSKHWANDIVRKYIDAAGVTKAGCCHLFRHTMATLMLENGADIRFIQAMLGHANLATTEIYTHVSIAKLSQVHKATHPAKMSRGDVDDDS